MADLDALLRLIDETEMTVEDTERVIAHLRRKQHSNTSTSPKKRIPGLHEHLGHAWISDDFDDELPDSFWGFDKPLS